MRDVSCHAATCLRQGMHEAHAREPSGFGSRRSPLAEWLIKAQKPRVKRRDLIF